MSSAKFRQWNPYTQQFTYWGRLEDGVVSMPVTASNNWLPTPDEQYIGSKDMHGVDIYKGDILAYRDGEFSYDAIVEWGDWGWYLVGIEPKDNYHFDDISPQEHEVIGNIHQNPELFNVNMQGDQA